MFDFTLREVSPSTVVACEERMWSDLHGANRPNIISGVGFVVSF